MKHRDAFVAIADPTRREILDLLLDQEVVAAGDIAAHFCELSRPAISRHLRLLRECGVVHSFKYGRTRNYSLNTEPLGQIHTGWLRAFAHKQTDSLKTLRDIVEERD